MTASHSECPYAIRGPVTGSRYTTIKLSIVTRGLFTAWAYCIRIAGQYFSMISETQYYVVDDGDDVSMECSFHADRYSMFDHPVLWRKQQLDEFSQINILGSINDPFIQTNRYEVSFDASEPRYELRLRISGYLTTLP